MQHKAHTGVSSNADIGLWALKYRHIFGNGVLREK
jgi:hypothetical protein